MPPHQTFIEMFLGSGAILRTKKPAKVNFGFDLSQKAISLTKKLITQENCKFDHLELLQEDAIKYVSNLTFCNDSVLIYADPPYMMHTRTSGAIYEHEMTAEQHYQLLEVLNSLNCSVMLSGYRSALYDRMLSDWRRIDYLAQTHAGHRPESLWTNFATPKLLHDYRFLGDDSRNRERIKRQNCNIIMKLKKLPLLERQAMIELINQNFNR